MKKHMISGCFFGLGIVIVLPLWVLCMTPRLVLNGILWIRKETDKWRRDRYCGLNIAGRNSAHRRLWELRRNPLLPLEQTTLRESGISLGLLDLPYELRELIWLEILHPADKIHIMYDPGSSRLYAAVKELPALTSNNAERQPAKGMILYQHSKGMVQPLEVNRVVYEETSRILYTSNTFTFESPGDPQWFRNLEPALFVAFTRTILPARIQQISSVRLMLKFDWSYDHKRKTYELTSTDRKAWLRTCQTLESMTGLRDLSLTITRARYMGKAGCVVEAGLHRAKVQGQTPENALLRPLLAVRVQPRFVVDTPWNADVIGELPDMPFKPVNTGASKEYGTGGG